MLFCVVFCKQKTAYEMRISGWSSDVCSSDLPLGVGADGYTSSGEDVPQQSTDEGQAQEVEVVAKYRDQDRFAVVRERQRGLQPVDVVEIHIRMPPIAGTKVAPAGRSEEHTSELQSLMRISYAVFCLKKKHLHITILDITSTHPI